MMKFRLNYVQLRRVFFGVCLPVRVAIAFIYYIVNEETITCGEECIAGYLVLRWLAGGALVVALSGMVYQEFQDRDRGFLGGLVWWKNMRRIHMLNYFGAAMFTWFNKYGSHYFLFADVALAFVYTIVRRIFIFYV